MTRWAAAVLALVVVGAVPLAAADEPKKPVGTWIKKQDEHTVTFHIKADGMRVILKGDGDRKIEADIDYGLTKDGILFGRISKVTPGGNGPEEGDLFSFRFKIEKDKLVLSDLTGTHINDDAKKIVEGDYEKEKK